VCPPAVDLPAMAAVAERGKVSLGAQNIHYMDEGPYTGEIAAPMLKGLAEYVLIGHSERRAMGEDDKMIAQKMAAAVRNGLTPVLCVGEKTLERQHNLALRVVVAQLAAALALLTAADVANVVVAYEPVWAIGTGKYATPDEIRPVIKAIRHTVEELYSADAASMWVIYGGSVTAGDCRAYLAMPGVDGLLVGGASLNYEEFAGIIKEAQAA
jgi:triosephosphate isomerase (TIM)